MYTLQEWDFHDDSWCIRAELRFQNLFKEDCGFYQEGAQLASICKNAWQALLRHDDPISENGQEATEARCAARFREQIFDSRIKKKYVVPFSFFDHLEPLSPQVNLRLRPMCSFTLEYEIMICTVVWATSLRKAHRRSQLNFCWRPYSLEPSFGQLLKILTESQRIVIIFPIQTFPNSTVPWYTQISGKSTRFQELLPISGVEHAILDWFMKA